MGAPFRTACFTFSLLSHSFDFLFSSLRPAGSAHRYPSCPVYAHIRQMSINLALFSFIFLWFYIVLCCFPAFPTLAGWILTSVLTILHRIPVQSSSKMAFSATLRMARSHAQRTSIYEPVHIKREEPRLPFPSQNLFFPRPAVPKSRLFPALPRRAPKYEQKEKHGGRHPARQHKRTLPLEFIVIPLQIDKSDNQRNPIGHISPQPSGKS